MHTPQRESELQALCSFILDMSPTYVEDNNGPDYCMCPLCGSEHYKFTVKMSEIKHEQYCPYLIAKGLSTNLIQINESNSKSGSN